MSRPLEISTAAILTALASSGTMEQAAALLGCSAPAIAARAKQNPEIQGALLAQSKAREDQIAKALRAHRGVLSKVAVEVGLDSGAAVRYHIIRSQRLRQVFEDVRERIVDVAEDNVFRAVEGGSVRDSWRLLQTLGKDRGYTERREIDATVEHRVDSRSTGELVALLDRLASVSPDLVEAEFSVLPPEDRDVLQKVLERVAAVEGVSS